MFLLFYNLSEQSFCIVPYIYVKTTTKKEITRKNKTKICKWFMMFTIHKKTNILFHFYKLHKLFRSKNVCCANSPGNDWFGVNSPVSNVTHCLYLALLDDPYSDLYACRNCVIVISFSRYRFQYSCRRVSN